MAPRIPQKSCCSVPAKGILEGAGDRRPPEPQYGLRMPDVGFHHRVTEGLKTFSGTCPLQAILVIPIPDYEHLRGFRVVS